MSHFFHGHCSWIEHDILGRKIVDQSLISTERTTYISPNEITHILVVLLFLPHQRLLFIWRLTKSASICLIRIKIKLLLTYTT